MNIKTQLHKPTIKDIAVALVGIATAILTFIRIPFAFILGVILLGLTVGYLLACIGFCDDETEMGQSQTKKVCDDLRKGIE